MSESNLDFLKDLESGGNSIDANRILAQLLNSDDIELKTEIDNPIALAKLKTLSEVLEDYKLKQTSKTINKFIKWYLLYMVSNKRKGRIEIVNAVSKLLTDFITKIDNKILGNKKEV